MIEEGIVVGIGLLTTIAKLPAKWKLWVLSHPITMDVIVFLFMAALHGGSATALLTAGVASTFCSLSLSAGRRIYGYHNKSGQYVRGYFNLA